VPIVQVDFNVLPVKSEMTYCKMSMPGMTFGPLPRARTVVSGVVGFGVPLAIFNVGAEESMSEIVTPWADVVTTLADSRDPTVLV